MGTNISFYVEVKVDNKWQSADKWIARGKWWQTEDRFYGNRNYILYAALGRHSDTVPNLEIPRGLPADISPELRERVEWCEFYDISYFTLEELQTYPWDLEVPFESSYIHKDSIEDYRNGKIGKWCSWRDVAYKKNPDDWELVGTLSVPMSQLCEEFVLETLPKMGKLGSPNNVRAIFGFN